MAGQAPAIIEYRGGIIALKKVSHSILLSRTAKEVKGMNFIATLFKSSGGIEEFSDAMLKGDLEKVKKMLKKNPKIANEKNDKGMTPLHIAVQTGRMEVAAVLLDLGANINAASTKGVTPLQCAAAVGNRKMVEFLKKKGAN